MPESLFDKVAGLSPAALLKKRLWYWCFPLNFVKFRKTPFFIERPLAASVNHLPIKSEAYSEPPRQTSKIERFAKTVVNYFHKILHVRCMTESYRII